MTSRAQSFLPNTLKFTFHRYTDIFNTISKLSLSHHIILLSSGVWPAICQNNSEILECFRKFGIVLDLVIV